MKYLSVKKSLIKACLFVFIACTAFMSSAKAGLDYYKIFLGKKLIYERYINKPLSLESLPISAADANETLTIYYYQCQAPNKTGSNRSIVLKDDKGNMVKQWSFANVQSNSAGMAIPVKELLQLQKANKSHALALYYTAEGRTGGEKLASIQAAPKDVSYLDKQVDEYNSQMVWHFFTLLFRNLAVV
ncbi:hypothetical protein FC093_16705 [Ilyomonas limi]|uniref:Uncharacterized protein n=1 Tax=Ilyomonas limi TaxID=2575867 RepID=A0A4U3KZQ3_9BACT|nr:hypothetical protein [Ilyomonas limi]TKK66676.1 hypothetical protein FC093_16705 [Ilyomonas limi]